ncbi:MAG: peptide deformylase [Prolixibacteraceae bacterium]|jgi:peptide deformylase|nr:peptide deformylase [Prolixibacteraceae bacterium]
MILPITLYGDPVLRKVAEDIDLKYEGLSELIENMFESMYNAEGVGLAAPQVGLSIRIFVVDLSPLEKDEPSLAGFRKAFINAKILERSGDEELMEEGCLSIPGIHEEVYRKNFIRIQYLEPDGTPRDETYTGYTARVLQHEYDHLDGVMFTDHCSPLRKRLLKRRLTEISKGITNASYRVKVPKM